MTHLFPPELAPPTVPEKALVATVQTKHTPGTPFVLGSLQASSSQLSRIEMSNCAASVRNGPASAMTSNGGEREVLKLEGNITEAEAASYLRTSVRVLRALRRSAIGPRFARVGRRIIYRLADLQEWQLAQVHASRHSRVGECDVV